MAVDGEAGQRSRFWPYCAELFYLNERKILDCRNWICYVDRQNAKPRLPTSAARSYLDKNY